MPTCTQLYSPGRDSAILREPAALGWIVFRSTFFLAPSCQETGLLSYSSISPSLLGIPFSFQTHYTHLEFFARLFLSGFSAQNDFQADWSSPGSYFHFELLPHDDTRTCLFILQTHLLLQLCWEMHDPLYHLFISSCPLSLSIVF